MRRFVAGVIAVFALGFTGGVAMMLDQLAGAGPQVPPELQHPPCAENRRPATDIAHRVEATKAGPNDYLTPNREVELRSQQGPDGITVLWARFNKSTNVLDRVWLDWSYRSESVRSLTRLRQCGPHPVGHSPDTPAITSKDAEGRARWFRACGQVPAEDRIPGERSWAGVFCTEWVRPPG